MKKNSNDTLKFENFNKIVWKYNFYTLLKSKNIHLENLVSILLDKVLSIEEKKIKLLEILGDDFKYDLGKIIEIF